MVNYSLIFQNVVLLIGFIFLATILVKYLREISDYIKRINDELTCDFDDEIPFPEPPESETMFEPYDEIFCNHQNADTGTYEENFLVKPTETRKQAELLPEKWIWVDISDGSGHIVSPSGNSYFNYDMTTAEFKDFNDEWDFMYGAGWKSVNPKAMPYKEFKEYAEKEIIKKLFKGFDLKEFIDKKVAVHFNSDSDFEDFIHILSKYSNLSWDRTLTETPALDLHEHKVSNVPELCFECIKQNGISVLTYKKIEDTQVLLEWAEQNTK